MKPISNIVMAKMLCMVSGVGFFFGGAVLVIAAIRRVDNFTGVVITVFSFIPLVIATGLLVTSKDGDQG
jgi:hypothetical protein